MSKRRPQSSTTKRPPRGGGSGIGAPRMQRESLTKFFGVQCCHAIFEARRNEVRRVFVSPELEEKFGRVLRWADRRGLPARVVSDEELARVAGTEHHEGVCFEAKPLAGLQPAELKRRLADLQRGVIVVLEGVENPHNVGAILRTACFFGVSAVILRSAIVSSLSGAACRIAEGAAEHVPLCIVPEYSNLFSVLKAAGFAVVATTPHEARSLYSVRWPEKVALFFGAEGSGLSEAVLRAADIKAAIPRLGPIESLNVAASVASVLTEARRDAVVKGLVRRIAASASDGSEDA